MYRDPKSSMVNFHFDRKPKFADLTHRIAKFLNLEKSSAFTPSIICKCDVLSCCVLHKTSLKMCRFMHNEANLNTAL